MANQVQAVKDTLDWREQFKKRPVAWSAGALGVGFAVGYCIANYAKGDHGYRYSSAIDRFGEESKQYAVQPILGAGGALSPQESIKKQGNGTPDSGPGFFQKVAHTHAFERVRDEAGNIGDAFVQELSKTAKAVVLPALITSLRNFIGDHLPNAGTATSERSSTYQPALERNQG